MPATGSAPNTLRDGRSDSSAHATSGTTTTWMFASTVAKPAPTSTIERFQSITSIAKNTPDAMPARRSRQPRAPYIRFSRMTSRPSTGSA